MAPDTGMEVIQQSYHMHTQMQGCEVDSVCPLCAYAYAYASDCMGEGISAQICENLILSLRDKVMRTSMQQGLPIKGVNEVDAPSGLAYREE